jgi:hypothetical protein
VALVFFNGFQTPAVPQNKLQARLSPKDKAKNSEQTSLKQP